MLTTPKGAQFFDPESCMYYKYGSRKHVKEQMFRWDQHREDWMRSTMKRCDRMRGVWQAS